MQTDTLKAYIEAARQEWHSYRPKVMDARAEASVAGERYWEAGRARDAAHEEYKRRKKLKQLADEFNVTDIGQLEMLWKLSNH